MTFHQDGGIGRVEGLHSWTWSDHCSIPPPHYPEGIGARGQENGRNTMELDRTAGPDKHQKLYTAGLQK